MNSLVLCRIKVTVLVSVYLDAVREWTSVRAQEIALEFFGREVHNREIGVWGRRVEGSSEGRGKDEVRIVEFEFEGS